MATNLLNFKYRSPRVLFFCGCRGFCHRSDIFLFLLDFIFFLGTLHTMWQIFRHQRFWTIIIRFSIPFGIQTSDEELDLPYISWIPNIHKNHYKHRLLRVHWSVWPSFYLFYSQICLHILSKRKRKEIWLSPMTKAHTPTEMSKGQSDNINNATKSSITQRLRTDLGRSVGVTTATQLVWFTGFTGPTFPLTATAV